MSGGFKKAIAGLAAAALLACAPGCSKTSAPSAAAPAPAGQAAAFPELEARALEGSAVFTAGVFGEAGLTAVCLWTADCPYCPAQLASLEKLATERGDEGFRAIGLLLGDGGEESLGRARARLAQGGSGLSQFIAPADFKLESVGAGPRVPCTVFVDSSGYIVSDAYAGERDKEELNETITRLLAASERDVTDNDPA